MAEAAYAALNAGDLDGFLALTTEDIEFTSLIAEAQGDELPRWGLFRTEADALEAAGLRG